MAEVTVIVSPSVYEGVLLRLVELPDGFGRVESWDRAAGSWVPGGGDGAELFDALKATPDVLAAFGVRFVSSPRA